MKKNLLKLTATAGLITVLAGCGAYANPSSPMMANASQTTNNTNAITQEEAKAAALQHAGVQESEVSNLTIKNDLDDGRSVIDVEFNANNTHYDYEIDEQSGTVVKHEKETVKTTQGSAKQDTASSSSSTQKQTTQNNAASSSSAQKQTAKQQTQSAASTITRQQAQTIALQDAGVSASSAKFIQVKEDYEKGQAVYEVEFYANQTEYDYEIAKSNGAILAKDYDIENWEPSQNTNNSTSASISLEKAKSIALAKVSGATNSNIRIEQDYDDGMVIYEGEIHYQGMEYEFEINGANGAIIEWSAERA